MVVLTVQSALAISGLPDHGLVLAVLLAGYVLGGGLAVLILRRLTFAFNKLDMRLEACARATGEHLKPALVALAEGDLTVELQAGTAALEIVADDELGAMLRRIELFRGAVLDCYDAYNTSIERLRGVIGTVANTAGSVTAASEEMSATSEEAGRASGEIAQAISNVAEGASGRPELPRTPAPPHERSPPR